MKLIVYFVNMSEALITAENIQRGYSIGKKRVEVLKGINLEIHRGEKVFLCGPSGAGKTTLMYTLAGLEKPDDGNVFIDGVNLYQLPKNLQSILRNTRMAYIFQNYYLLPEMTALENVLIPALIGGKHDRNAAMAALERVGLEHRADHLPAELSGGEQQRVAIARALVNKPEIIFADEPTGNLDSNNGAEVMRLLLELSNADGATLVVVTHDTILSRYGDRTLIVNDGVISETACNLIK